MLAKYPRRAPLEQAVRALRRLGDPTVADPRLPGGGDVGERLLPQGETRTRAVRQALSARLSGGRPVPRNWGRGFCNCIMILCSTLCLARRAWMPSALRPESSTGSCTT